MSGGTTGVDTTADKADSLERTVGEARDLAEQLRKELAEQERIRLEDRQELLKKMDCQRTQFENEIKAMKDRNDTVSQEA